MASPEIISCFLKVKAPYNLNSVTLARGLEALNGREDRARQVKEIRRRARAGKNSSESNSGRESGFPLPGELPSVSLWRCF